MRIPTPEENVDVNMGPPADPCSAKATISPPEVADDGFLFPFPGKAPIIEVPVDFELVEHAEVVEMGGKTTRAKWSSWFWRY